MCDYHLFIIILMLFLCHFVQANEEEAQDRKAMLCEQFQRLVEDASRGRTSKLNFITKHFM